MGVCEVCGNDFDATMNVIVGGETHVFDSFECAIHAVAPRAITAPARSASQVPRPRATASERR